MPELIAQSTESADRWRRTLPEERVIAIGRQAGTWSVPWDGLISRRHFQVEWRDDRLHVERLPGATNPIFFDGTPSDRFTLGIGQHFVVGKTTFRVVDESLDLTRSRPQPFWERTFELDQLAATRFSIAEQRIDALVRLPELITHSGNDVEMAMKITSLLLDAISQATAAAVVEESSESEAPFQVVHYDVGPRRNREFAPSVRLIERAWGSGNAELHRWRQPQTGDAAATERPGTDWAFCLPVPSPSRRWALYVEGVETEADEAAEVRTLQDDLKFTQVVAHMVSNVREARYWEQHLARLRPFFSPSILDWLVEAPGRHLEPGYADIAVLFCDLRGFSDASERAGDLMQLLRRVGRALGVMTSQILAEGGVVGDFHGDAAMGFWGWPATEGDPVLQAARAALAIRARLDLAAGTADDHLAGFRAGIGLACGSAVAGPIGTHDQVKVTVFGPVVNLAARLETLTKKVHAPVLIDQSTADHLRSHLPPELGRLRRVARVRIAGTSRVEEVSELLPPAAQMAALPDEAVAAYEEALDAFEQGDWERAHARLHEVPPGDRVKDWIVGEIVRHDRRPPADWDGVLALSSDDKS